MTPPLDPPTSSEPATTPTPARRARVFFWSVLSAAAAVSVTGNAVQALLHNGGLPAVSVAVAVIPPMALLAAVHGVAVLARVDADSGTVHRVCIAFTVLIAAAAFWMSATALQDLALSTGVPSTEAWLWPLIVEGSMTQATISLLTLTRTEHSQPGRPAALDPAPPPAETPTVTAPSSADATSQVTPTSLPSGQRRTPAEGPDTVRTPSSSLSDLRTPSARPTAVRTHFERPRAVRTPEAPSQGVHTPDRSRAAVRTAASGSDERGKSADTPVSSTAPATHEQLAMLAERVCRRDPRGRRDAMVVAEILLRHRVEGQNATRIAQSLGCSRSTVSRILRDAANLSPPPPAISVTTNPPVATEPAEPSLQPVRAHDPLTSELPRSD
ncbi:DUF2637 domain-containing protein [Nocardia thailandica]